MAFNPEEFTKGLSSAGGGFGNLTAKVGAPAPDFSTMNADFGKFSDGAGDALAGAMADIKQNAPGALEQLTSNLPSGMVPTKMLEDFVSTNSGNIIGGKVPDFANSVAGDGMVKSIKDQFAKAGNKTDFLTQKGMGGKKDNKGAIQETLGRSSDSIVEDMADSRRITIRARPDDRERVYGPLKDDNIIRPIYDTNGVLFPFTPSIQISQAADYGEYSPVHSIQSFLSYNRTQNVELNISGKFTAQSREEARYCLAVIHFFRTLTKMYFGQGSHVGNTPPVLLLNGHGDLMFNNLPIIVKSYNVALPESVDYVRYYSKELGSDAWIPTVFDMGCTVVVQHTPARLRQFDLDKFRTGKLLSENKYSNKGANRGGWI